MERSKSRCEIANSLIESLKGGDKDNTYEAVVAFYDFELVIVGKLAEIKYFISDKSTFYAISSIRKIY